MYTILYNFKPFLLLEKGVKERKWVWKFGNKEKTNKNHQNEKIKIYE